MSTIGFYTDAGEQTNVSASVAEAEAAAGAAGVSETNAALSETNSEASAVASQASADSVADNAAAAALSETNAAVSESNASASAGNAATSESNAATSETNANTSESNAAISAAAALVSENNAAATLADALTQDNNLSDVSSAATSRANLDVYSKAETDNGRRNYLINGDKSVNQREFVGGQPAAGVYGYDRWKGDTLGTREEQIIENTRTINQTFTISWVGGTGTADVDSVTGLNSGDSFTLDVTGNFSVIVPTDAIDIQLESGSVATPFEYVSAGDNLAACQRYYTKTDANRDMASLGVSGGNETIRTYVWSFPVTMRTIPSINASVSPGSLSAIFNSIDSVTIRSTGLTGSSSAAVNAGTSADAEL